MPGGAGKRRRPQERIVACLRGAGARAGACARHGGAHERSGRQLL